MQERFQDRSCERFQDRLQEREMNIPVMTPPGVRYRPLLGQGVSMCSILQISELSKDTWISKEQLRVAESKVKSLDYYLD